VGCVSAPRDRGSLGKKGPVTVSTNEYVHNSSACVQSKGEELLYSSPLRWDDGPRLLNLWHIVNQFDIHQLVNMMERFAAWECAYLALKRKRGGARLLTPDETAQLKEGFDRFGKWADSHGMDELGRMARQDERHVSAKGIDVSSANAHLHAFKTFVIRHLKNKPLLRIAEDRFGLIDEEWLFGLPVHSAFPSAREDIKAAGNCLAAECSTAAVFHLMRVAEYGLRALARDRRIQKLPKGPAPIELATWEEIIRELEKAETAIQGYPKTLAREAQFDFYHGAMMQFKRFKNIFRNRVMHAREDFGRTEAMGVYENVRDFMQTLARCISESKRTPVIWKGKKWESG